MLRYLKEPSIHQTTLIVIIFAGIFAIASAFVVIYNESRELTKQIQEAKEQYIQTQKQKSIDEASKLYQSVTFLADTFSSDTLEAHVQTFVSDVFEREHAFAFVLTKEGKILGEPVSGRALGITLDGLYKKDNTPLLAYLSQQERRSGGMYEFSATTAKGELEGLVFVRHYAPLDWLIGSGVYLEGLSAAIAAKKEESHQKITAFILKITTLTLFLYLAGMLKYRYLTQRITRDIKTIDAVFKEAPRTYEFIDPATITFVEFKEISAHANAMIAKIKQKNRDMVTLNANLEKIVEEKTSALQQSMDYANALLKQQDSFVNNAIHEINTPLTIIMMNIELHNLKLPKTPYLTKIEAAAKVLENIYDDLGYVVKKHRADYPKERIDMTAFLYERLAYFHDVAEGNDVSFTCKAHEGMFVFFNETELQRIIDNNLSNAIKYAKVRSKIRVSLERNAKHEVVFTVVNEGETIQMPEKLFERYYREDQVRGGFGLGLNIVKEICDKYGVVIQVRSKEGVSAFEYTFAKEGR